jgi:hypothetical protein
MAKDAIWYSGFLANTYDSLRRLRKSDGRFSSRSLRPVGIQLENLEWGTYWLREELGMPNRQNNNTAWKGYVDVRMTDSEKETMTAWDVHDDDLWLVWQDAIISGHKASLTYNKENQAFVAALTGMEGHPTNAGYTLTAYAPDWYIAVRALLFKHVILLETDWRRAGERVSDSVG